MGKILDTTVYQPGFGLQADRICRNGKLTDGVKVNQLSDFINTIASRRLHVLAQGGCGTGTFLSSSGNNVLVKAHTSPNCGGVQVWMICGRSTSATTMGSYTWQVDATAQQTRYLGGSTAGTNGPDDLVCDGQRFQIAGAELSGDTVYEFRLSVSSTVSVLFYCIYEVPRTSLDLALHTAANWGRGVFDYGAPILDSNLSSLTDTLWKMYRRQGVNQILYGSTTGTAASQTGTTWKNILDGSTSGFSSSAAGFWTIPYRKNRLAGTTVDVVLWAYGGTNVMSGGEVRFVNSAGTIGTITGFVDTIDEFRTQTATLDATISTSDLVIIEHRHSNAGDLQRTFSAGIYEFLT